MNNPIQNYKIILKALQENCSHIPSFKQIKTPKLSNLELAAFGFTAHLARSASACCTTKQVAVQPEGLDFHNRRQA